MTPATFCTLTASIAILAVVVWGLAHLLVLMADDDDWSGE